MIVTVLRCVVEDHQSSVDRTKDPHGGADDHQGNVDQPKEPHGGADDHHSSRDGAEDLCGEAGAMSGQDV